MIDWLIRKAPPARRILVFNLAQLAVWLLLIPPSILWWKESIVYVVFLSVSANVIGAVAATTAALADLAADPDETGR